MLGYDEFADVATLLKRPPYLDETGPWHTRPIENPDDSETTYWLQSEYDLFAPTSLVAEGIQTLAHRNHYHPVRDYLRRLTWDKTSRLDTWLPTYCHAADTPYTRAVGAKTLIAAVARVEDPGCKVDTVTITVNKQGTGKSMVWRTLAGDAWFTDHLPDLHDKDAMQSLRGKWIIELGELAVLQRSEVEAIKRFISANQITTVRPTVAVRPLFYARTSLSALRIKIVISKTRPAIADSGRSSCRAHAILRPSSTTVTSSGRKRSSVTRAGKHGT